LLNATVRRDGSSALGTDNRFVFFPAFGAGWIISEESFLADNSFINLLKIRAGWGKTGNQNSLTDFAFASRFAQDPASTGYDLNASNGSYVTGIGLLSRGNPDLKWETSETINVGLCGSPVTSYRGSGISTLYKYWRNRKQGSGYEPWIFSCIGRFNT
jgi:hypothetical protein